MSSDALAGDRVCAHASSKALPGFLALVSDEYAIVLRGLLDQYAHVTRLADPDGLRDASNRPYDALLLQWTEVVRYLNHVHDREAILWHEVRRGSAPALVLLDLEVDPFPPLLELGLSGATGLLLQGIHDVDPAPFARRLLEASRSYRARRLIPTIAVLTESAPEPFRRALAAFVQNPACFLDVKEFALAAYCTTRTLERQLHVLGISSLRALLACVRLAHLHVRTPDASLAPNAFASSLGFRNASALLNAMLRITACGTVSEFLALPPARVMQNLTIALQGKPHPHR